MAPPTPPSVPPPEDDSITSGTPEEEVKLLQPLSVKSIPSMEIAKVHENAQQREISVESTALVTSSAKPDDRSEESEDETPSNLLAEALAIADDVANAKVSAHQI